MRRVGITILFAAVAFAAPPARAQTTLAWKLAAGERFDLHVEQQTASTVTVVNKTTKTTIEMTLDSTWAIESVEDGIAKIRQTIRRAQVKVQAADSPPVVYDTAAPGQPSGAEKDLATAVGPLVDPDSSILLTMNERGEIAAAELSPRLAELWAAGKPAAAAKKQPAQQSLDALLKQPLVILPAKAVARGEKWETTRELTTPTGKFSQQIDYTYDGRRDVAGKSSDAISFSATLAPAAPGKFKIKEQSQTGTIHFDGEAGRMISGEQKQMLVTETPYRDATITVVVESQVSRSLTPR